MFGCFVKCFLEEIASFRGRRCESADEVEVSNVKNESIPAVINTG
jgi:hypothetical protein